MAAAAPLRLAALLLFVLSGPRPTGAAEFFAAPNGSPEADGTRERPWDLASALQQNAIRPGDTLWLRGGTYRGDFTSRLKGAEGAPITVRQYPGERAIIDLVAPDREATSSSKASGRASGASRSPAAIQIG